MKDIEIHGIQDLTVKVQNLFKSEIFGDNLLCHKIILFDML